MVWLAFRYTLHAVQGDGFTFNYSH